MIRLMAPLFDEWEALISTLGAKADEFARVYKMGRTQLQDAANDTW